MAIEQRRIGSLSGKAGGAAARAGQAAKGNTVEQPPRAHVITRIETPSESIKTSFLSNL